MDKTNSKVLGHLIEVTSECFVARLSQPPDSLSSEKMIGMDKVRVGQVGSYLMVKQTDIKILCMVEKMWLDTAADGRETHKISLIPLGEFNQSREFDRGINHYPTTGAELHMVSNWNLERVFSDHSDVFYKVGKLSTFESIDVYLDASISLVGMPPFWDKPVPVNPGV